MTTFSSLAIFSKQTLAPYRLRRHADYQRVYKASRKYHSASMSYFFRVRSPEELAQLSGPRIGLTVGRVMGKAVDRNRIKRRMREAIRLHLAILLDGNPDQNNAHHNIDLVLHPRKLVAVMDFALLEQELAKLFHQVAAKALSPDPPPPPRPVDAERSARRAAKALPTAALPPRAARVSGSGSGR